MNKSPKKRKYWISKMRGRKLNEMNGARIFVEGCSVNEAKKFLGKLAKKIKIAGSGTVEIIHTDKRGRVWWAVLALKQYIAIRDS